MDVEYELKSGGMQPVEDKMQWDILSGIVEEQKKSGVDIEMISAEEARKITPQLSKDIYGALYSPTGGKVNPIKLTLGFARAAKLGATIQIETEVTGIIMEGNAVKGVHTTKGDYFADTIVNACGSWAASQQKWWAWICPSSRERDSSSSPSPLATSWTARCSVPGIT